MLTKVNICTVHLPPGVLKRVSTLKYQRCMETDCNSPRSVLSALRGDSTLDVPLASDGSPPQGTRKFEHIEFSTAQSGEQCVNTSLAAKGAAPEDGNTCLVCWENESDAVLLECGHSGICIVCAQKLWREGRSCLLCREGFAAIMRIVDGHSATVRTRAPCLVLLYSHTARRGVRIEYSQSGHINCRFGGGTARVVARRRA